MAAACARSAPGRPKAAPSVAAPDSARYRRRVMLWRMVMGFPPPLYRRLGRAKRRPNARLPSTRVGSALRLTQPTVLQFTTLRSQMVQQLLLAVEELNVQCVARARQADGHLDLDGAGVRGHDHHAVGEVH